MKTSLPPRTLADKVLGCWIGKCIGGAAGMPYEGVAGPTAIPLPQPRQVVNVPNDDLDLQLLWLVAAERVGPAITSAEIGEAFLRGVPYFPDEYGVANWNMRRGILPPLSGLHNNAFTRGMGSAIRSEIWACLSPLRPRWAAWHAAQDARVDHAGEGVLAEVFLAAAQSAAFALPTAEAALRAGLRLLPPGSELAAAVRFALDTRRRGMAFDEALRAFSLSHGSPNWTDCVMNVGIVALCLLHGNGDFDRTLALTLRAGQDTDCTAATACATLGILKGTRGIPRRWRDRFGGEIAIHPEMTHHGFPDSVEELTRRTLVLAGRFADAHARRPAPALPPVNPRDPIDDRNGWLVAPGEAGRAAILRAEEEGRGPARLRHSFPGVHLDLDPWCRKGPDTLHLLTWLVAPRAVRGQLMVCAGTGVAAWLGGRSMVNQYGRRPPIPVFHRTEGGGTVPVTLPARRPVPLRIHLLQPRAPQRVTAVVGDDACRYIVGLRYQASAKG
jgi:ADP-ribosylglycohydrolase